MTSLVLVTIPVDSYIAVNYLDKIVELHPSKTYVGGKLFTASSDVHKWPFYSGEDSETILKYYDNALLRSGWRRKSQEAEMDLVREKLWYRRVYERKLECMVLTISPRRKGGIDISFVQKKPFGTILPDCNLDE
jgi:hypothetical protein